jgi:hypothetical protein
MRTPTLVGVGTTTWLVLVSSAAVVAQEPSPGEKGASSGIVEERLESELVIVPHAGDRVRFGARGIVRGQGTVLAPEVDPFRSPGTPGDVGEPFARFGSSVWPRDTVLIAGRASCRSARSLSVPTTTEKSQASGPAR